MKIYGLSCTLVALAFCPICITSSFCCPSLFLSLSPPGLRPLSLLPPHLLRLSCSLVYFLFLFGEKKNKLDMLHFLFIYITPKVTLQCFFLADVEPILAFVTYTELTSDLANVTFIFSDITFFCWIFIRISLATIPARRFHYLFLCFQYEVISWRIVFTRFLPVLATPDSLASRHSVF